MNTTLLDRKKYKNVASNTIESSFIPLLFILDNENNLKITSESESEILTGTIVNKYFYKDIEMYIKIENNYFEVIIDPEFDRVVVSIPKSYFINNLMKSFEGYISGYNVKDNLKNTYRKDFSYTIENSISCANAINSSDCISFEGTCDLYIDDVLILTNASEFEIYDYFSTTPDFSTNNCGFELENNFNNEIG